MKKYLCRYVVIDYEKPNKFREIEESEPMNENEFFEFCKRFIIVSGNPCEYGAFCNEKEILESIEEIKENGVEDFALGHNPYDDIGFEEILVELIEE